MSSQTVRLPTHFPVGTRYVVEGRGGRIRLHYLEFPDGRHVDLPADLGERPRAAAAPATRRRRSRGSARKF
jgi:hypothetical protein